MSARGTAGLVVAFLVAYAAWLSADARSSPGEIAAVGSVDVAEICAQVQAGDLPVFVDVREPEEFAEERLPGAVSMPIREMRARAHDELDPDALLVPYCLKDFRGFEGARRLAELGFERVRVMEHLGINGWKAAGLPTAGAVPGHTDLESHRTLVELCREPGR